MSRRYLDKLIVLTGTVLLIILLSGSSIGGADVALFLASLIMLTLSEVKKGPIISYFCAAAALAAAVFRPEGFVLIPSAVHVLTSCVDVRKNRVMFISRMVICVLLLLTGMFTIGTMPVSLMYLFLCITGAYIGLAGMYAREKEEEMTRKFDDARLDSMNARRLSRETLKNADNEVYMATLKERNRIAREIHDNTGHMITRVIVQLQAIKIINKDEKVGEQLDSVAQTLDLAMTGIRKSVHELHDDSIDLSIGINELAAPLHERFEVEVTTSIDSPADNTVKNAILGIVKEGVTNISKYSKGDRVIIEVIENVTFWRIRVFDNGRNEEKEYDVSDTAGGDTGIGLKNIGTRASSAGGRATVTSSGEGFTILVTLPKERVKDEDTHSR